MPDKDENRSLNFIEQIIEDDNRSGKWGGRVHTRFPPEPNGLLHIGHAKSICLNFGLAQRYGGQCNLRFDDTNPVKEEDEYVRAIIEDVRWLGFRWNGVRDDDPAAGVKYGSEYFRELHDWAVELIRKGLAYVDDQTAEQIRESRGTLTKPGRNSPFRDRSVEENVDLFDRMRQGEFADGSKVLRARIDMASPNLNLRDPVMYRVLHAAHHRTGNDWCVYPMYDWAHGLEDSIENGTHSICTLEFENHRPLYDWFIDAVNRDRGPDSEWGSPIPHPQQIEFGRLNLSYTVMSKRKLLELVGGGHVRGWDDPRMPTLAGLRRRGYTPESIRALCGRVGVAKFGGITEVALLEHCAREHLNQAAPRVLCVLRPLKVVITNWPDKVDWLEAVNNPEDESAGRRKVPFSRELYIERNDFMEDPPKKFFRLAPGREVRLRYAYWIKCVEAVKDPATGEVTELRCTYDPATRGGEAPPPDADGKIRKVKATLHWVSAEHAADAEVRLYDRLFKVEAPDRKPKDAPEDWDFAQNLNPDSLETLPDAKLEAGWRAAADCASWPDGIARVQFERQGYFCLDPDATDAKPVFNRTVTLKDTWARIAKNQSQKR